MPIVLQNDTASTLRVGVAAGDTTLIVASGQGSRFPTLGVGDYFYATLEDTAGDKEIVQITARSGDSLTAVRGAESTTAREFPAGSTIEMRVTAASVVDAAANAVSLSALGVTASAAELNVLDGITASTAELNRMDGVTWTLTDYNTLTATAAELNLLDGVTWTLTDYNTLTASAAELNVLDGITASTAELNLLDGVTWTLTDYNTLTATAAELNALDGVTTAGTNIVRAADAPAQRTVLGLGGLSTLDILDEDDFASDSATRPPSQQSAKAYVDAHGIIQRVYSSTASVSTTTAVIPVDDTLPQSTEGTELLTAVITATSASSRLRIRAQVHAANSGNNRIVMSLFAAGGADAVAAMQDTFSSNNTVQQYTLEHEMAAGTTSPQTVSLRVGTNLDTLTINGQSGARIFGGALVSSLTVEEIKP